MQKTNTLNELQRSEEARVEAQAFLREFRLANSQIPELIKQMNEYDTEFFGIFVSGAIKKLKSIMDLVETHKSEFKD